MSCHAIKRSFLANLSGWLANCDLEIAYANTAVDMCSSHMPTDYCRMSHSRPGTVSLSIGTNDDEPGIRQRPGYRNTEFVITTGSRQNLFPTAKHALKFMYMHLKA